MLRHLGKRIAQAGIFTILMVCPWCIFPGVLSYSAQSCSEANLFIVSHEPSQTGATNIWTHFFAPQGRDVHLLAMSQEKNCDMHGTVIYSTLPKLWYFELQKHNYMQIKLMVLSLTVRTMAGHLWGVLCFTKHHKETEDIGELEINELQELYRQAWVTILIPDVMLTKEENNWE